MIILGIDPAIRTTGYGVIRVEEGGRAEILDCGLIVNKPKEPHSECLRRLLGGMKELIAAFSPDAAAIEEPFMGRNAGTAIILGMARGAIVAALADCGVPVYSYSARSAKRAAVGSGGASKEQVALMMSAQLGIDCASIKLDATDALAIALCHGQLACRGELADFLTRKI